MKVDAVRQKFLADSLEALQDAGFQFAKRRPDAACVIVSLGRKRKYLSIQSFLTADDPTVYVTEMFDE